jgi:DNA-binding transcriptional regulator YdaS (Cro superfamily)
MWEQVPSDRVTDVSRATGIPPEQLRPDLASIFAPSTMEKVS